MFMFVLKLHSLCWGSLWAVTAGIATQMCRNNVWGKDRQVDPTTGRDRRNRFPTALVAPFQLWRLLCQHDWDTFSLSFLLLKCHWSCSGCRGAALCLYYHRNRQSVTVIVVWRTTIFSLSFSLFIFEFVETSGCRGEFSPSLKRM